LAGERVVKKAATMVGSMVSTKVAEKVGRWVEKTAA